jgi:SAM-dependent methyltransferase
VARSVPWLGRSCGSVGRPDAPASSEVCEDLPVGIWTEEVVPRATDLLLSTASLDRFRREAVSDLSGDVVEIGFGSGLNLAFYDPAVRTVSAVEPSPVARRLAARRIARATPRATPRVTFVGGAAEALPFEDGSVDAVVSTFTLCTVPDPGRSLREVLRVLRPGGRFSFLEHGLSFDTRVAQWQHRLTPVQRRVAAGCHLDRPIEALVRASGLHVVALRRERAPGPRALGPWASLCTGVAERPWP